MATGCSAVRSKSAWYGVAEAPGGPWYGGSVVDLGGDPDQLLHAGLDPSALDQLTAFISSNGASTCWSAPPPSWPAPTSDFAWPSGKRLASWAPSPSACVIPPRSATLACAAKYLPVHNAAVAFAVSAGSASEPRWYCACWAGSPNHGRKPPSGLGGVADHNSALRGTMPPARVWPTPR